MTSGTESLSSTQRPIPLEARSDLAIIRMQDQGPGSWVVKDPLSLKYHRLQPEQQHVLQRLDGKRSLDDLQHSLTTTFPTVVVQSADVQRLISELHSRGLLTSLRAGRGNALQTAEAKQRRVRIKSLLSNILYLKLPGFDPTAWLDWTYGWFGWMFSPTIVLAATMFIGWSLMLVLVQWDLFARRLPAFEQFFGWPNLLWLWASIGVTKLVHEWGHAVCCRRMGAQCHEIGVMLLILCPTMYTDATDSWMLRNKWKRIAVASAGMYFESLLAAIAVLIWWNTQPGLLNHLALNVFAVSSVTTVVFNANPLLRYDGYYILSDWLEIPNLRQRSDRAVRDLVSRVCLGLDPPPDPFLDGANRRKLIVYGILAGAYRLFVVFGVALFLYGMLEPWGLSALAVALAGVSIGGIVIRTASTYIGLIREAGEGEVSAWRVSITAALLTGLFVAGLIVPLPLHVESGFQIQPHDQHDVYVATPGVLIEAPVQPGDRVKRNDVLARLSNPEKADARERLFQRSKVEELAVDVAYAMDDDARVHLAKEKLAGTREELKDFDRQLEALTLRAPCDGVVIAAPMQPAPSLEKESSTMRRWNGHPLEARNLGCWLDRQTLALSIAPDRRVDAVLYVDQSHRPDVSTGQTVELKFDHLAETTFAARVSQIGLRERSSAPQELSQKTGGDAATVTDRQGREQFASVAYQVTVTLEEETELLQPGMRGTARFLVDRRSAFDWLWRAARQTLNFKL